MRTQDEIVARLKEDTRADLFGFAQTVLLDALDFEHARPFLKEGVTPEQWNVKREADGFGRELQFPLLREEDLKAAALDYLKFAWSKARDHRSISAERSVTKLFEFCWLLGLDTEKVKAAEYQNYGCPMLKVISELLEAPLPTDAGLQRMMQGKACTDECEYGCS